MEKEILETFVELEHTIIEGNFNLKCKDGIATGSNGRYNVEMEYPKMAELSADQKQTALDYRGIKEGEATFGDIMMKFGKITKFNKI
jgi:hypothetical protein